MATKGEPITTKFNVDISELKAEFQEATRQIKLVNSEFKAATSGMDNWSNSADGLQAKLKQLTEVQEAEEKKLESLKKQYELVAAESGENSAAAQELMVRINNQQAAVNKTAADFRKYEQKLADVNAAAEEAANAVGEQKNAYEKLQDTIKEQEQSLSRLKEEYANVKLEQGESSEEARQLAAQIERTSTELKDNRAKLEQASQAADEFDTSLEEVEQSAEDTSEGFTVMKGALSDLVADGIRGAIDALKEFAAQSETSYNSFQVQTGASAEEMGRFKKRIDELYLDGMGEDLNDVAEKMAKVKQYTGEVDPDKMKELTEYTMTFTDAMGGDFEENLRGADALIENMGLTAEEAFDLMAVGVQNGLDKSGELSDNIAEYSQLWEQAGFSAEEMFAILENGLDSGAYNLDKVNDFVKEFTISLADGRIEENIKLFSKDTEKLFKEWKKGKKTSKDVFESVIKDLNNAENEQEALTTAGTVWSSLGEDNALKVIKSLTKVNDNYKTTKGTMEEINKIKYDDVASQFQVVGRRLQNELLKPMAEKALPLFQDFADFAIENMDEIGTAIKVVGGIMVTTFAVNKIAGFITSIKTLATTFGAMTSPIGLVSGAIGVLVGAFALQKEHIDNIVESNAKLSESEEALVEKIDARSEAYKQMDAAKQETLKGIDAEFIKYGELARELDGIVDKNGKIKKGYEDRAATITGILSEALGIEIGITDGVIQKYGDLKKSIDEVIQSKKAEAIVSATQSDYEQAIRNQTDAYIEYSEAQKAAEENEKKLAEAKKEVAAVNDRYDDTLIMNQQTLAAWQRELLEAESKVEGLEKKQSELDSATKKAEETWVGYNATIQNHEGLIAAIASNDAAKIDEAMNKTLNSFITAEVGTKESLEKQVENMTKNYNALKAAAESGGSEVVKEAAEKAKMMVDLSTAELDKFENKAKDSMGKAVEGAKEGFNGKSFELTLAAQDMMLNTDAKMREFLPNFDVTGQYMGDNLNAGVSSKSPLLVETGTDIANKTNEALGSADTQKTGSQKGAEFDTGLDSQKGNITSTSTELSDATNQMLGYSNTLATGSRKGWEFNTGLGGQKGNISSTGKTLSNTADDGLASANMLKTGSQKGAEFTGGISSKTGDARAAGEKVGNEANAGAASADSYSSGANFTQGFINGVGSLMQSVRDKAWSIGRNAIDSLRNAIAEGSPSKITTRSGGFFGMGFVNGIAGQVRNAVKKAATLGKEAVRSLNDSIEHEQINVSANVGKTNLSRSVGTSMATSGASYQSRTVNNYYNFNQTNNSPKALSRLEIYRQTKNQLFAAKGRLQYV